MRNRYDEMGWVEGLLAARDNTPEYSRPNLHYSLRNWCYTSESPRWRWFNDSWWLCFWIRFRGGECLWVEVDDIEFQPGGAMCGIHYYTPSPYNYRAWQYDSE